jgi:hypothetical protein
MVIRPIKRRGSKLGSMSFSTISIKFLIDRVPIICSLLWDFWIFEDEATGTDDHEYHAKNVRCAEIFQTSPHMSSSVIKYSS